MSSITAVVPVYGRPDLLRSCLDCIPDDVQIVVVDDASPEAERAEVYSVVEERRSPKLRFFKQTTNAGFPATVNRGMSKVKTDYAILLNTDVVLASNAWDVMRDELDADKTLGIVSPMLVFTQGSRFGIPGTIQHVGMAFDIWGIPQHLFIGWSNDNPRAVQRRYVNCVTGACFMTRTLLWRSIGGFAEAYGKGTFEDIEYCVRVRMEGYQIVVNPQAVGSHMVGQSSAVRQLGFPIQQNAQIFHLRLGQAVVNDDYLFW